MKLMIPFMTAAAVAGILFGKDLIKTGNTSSKVSSHSDSTTTDSLDEFTIAAVGDLMCHSTQYNFARVEGDSFNFAPCFDYVLPYLQSADLLIGNLETTFAGTGIPYSGYPYFNTPDDYATAVKQIGFDFIVTANNHSNDTGEKGILRTINVLDGLDMPHTGTFTSAGDRDSIRIMEVAGTRIAIVSYTYSTNGLDLTPGKPWLVNYCDSSLIEKDIAASRRSGANLVIVFYHFGNEYERMPSAYQEDFVNHAVASGADIVLGSHPHVLQPAHFYKTNKATLDTGFVAYSLGNFISNQQDEYTDEGVILNLHFLRNNRSGKISLQRVDYVPTWVYKGKNEQKKLHVVFPAFMVNDSTSLPAYITQPYKNEMQSALKNTAETMTKMSDRVYQYKPE